MAFKMNKDRISLRGSADTPGPFSADHTGKITIANKMADGVPDGPGDSGMANMNTGPILKVGDPETYEEEQARTGNEPLTNPDGNPDNSSTTKSVNINQGGGGKSKGTATTRSVRRVKGELADNARWTTGAGRIGEETTTRDSNNKIMQTRTVLAGTSGFKNGRIKTASVNSIKPKGTTTSSMPTAGVLEKKKKKGSTMMYRGGKNKH